MAKQTNQRQRSLTIYSIYLRNHGKWNTFQKLKQDLPRVSGMGFDAIWLMPIHPIGRLSRKGDLGCPYSIQDYDSVNPEYGTEEDFAELVQAAHDLGLKVLIDVVYHHTSHDSMLWKRHPDFFLRDKNGQAMCKEPEWSDVIDLDYSHAELWPILINSLIKWSKLGVDGFRCDVASLVPISFWIQARESVAAFNPDTIWLAESVETEFIRVLRNHGHQVWEDAELYEAFDILYDYDIYPEFDAFAKGELALSDFLAAVEHQDQIYPDHYIKLRFIENHDRVRFSSIRNHLSEKIIFTILTYMLKGATLVYAGQETADTHTPSLFELDPVHFETILPSYSDLLTRLNYLVKDEPFQAHEVSYKVLDNELLMIRYPQDALVAVLNFGDRMSEVELGLTGKYQDVLTGEVWEGITTTRVKIPRIFKKL